MATREATGIPMDLPTLQSTEIAHTRPGPQSPQREKEAAKAISHTAAWQPSLGGRRESYSQEHRRRELMMGSVGISGKEGEGDVTTANAGAENLGFSEGRSS